MKRFDANAKWVVLLGVIAAVATIIGTLYTIGIFGSPPLQPVAVSVQFPTQPAAPTATQPVVPTPAQPAAPTATQPVVPTPSPTPDYSVREVNNNDSGISYTGSCGYNHGLSASLYNDDVEICKQQNDSFTYTFTGTSIYLVTVYYQNHGGTISCYIDNSFTMSYTLDSSDGVDSYGLRYDVELPIAPKLTYAQHTASCTMTSASGTFFFVDALIINK